MSGTKWLDEREARAWQGLQKMQMQLSAELARQVSAHSDLSYPDYLVLVALTAEPEGSMRPSELGQMLGWEQSRVSHHVARMMERGLVSKRECPSDRRGAYVVVTDHGWSAIRQAAPGHVAAVRRLFVDRLDPKQLDVMGDIADKILAGLAEARSTPGGLPPEG